METQSQPAGIVASHADLSSEDKSTRLRYTSFVLRCWAGHDGQIIARLFEVRSGRSWSLADLDELPGLVRRWLARDVDPE